MDRKDILGSFWEDDTKLNVLVLHSFSLLWTFQEWDIENISIATVQLAQKFLQVCIPSNTEWVVPSSKDRISRLDLEIGLSFIASES